MPQLVPTQHVDAIILFFLFYSLFKKLTIAIDYKSQPDEVLCYISLK